jgi:AraC-like DNA-binding protein
VSYREFVPHAALRSHVDRLWTSASSTPEGARPVLPDGCIDVIFDLLSGEVHVVGAMTRAQVLAPTDRSCLVAVRFRPGGALPFLRVPAEELTDRVVDARALGLRWATEQPLEAVADLRDALEQLEARLLTRVGAADAPHPIIAYAARALFRPDPPSIASLEASTGWSRQHLTRMFSRHVGVGPKVLARVARLQRAVVALQCAEGGLADLAAHLGYFDQAHMALDFRRLAGVAPSAVSASRGSIFPIPSLLTEA